MSDTNLRDGMLIGMGNPLLDMSLNVDHAFLDRYGLKPDDAILAKEEHEPLFKELGDNPLIEYIAGGSTQNSLRVAQWLLGEFGVSIYLGCVGEDKFRIILELKAKQNGVNVLYQTTKIKPTGKCAVLITDEGSHRSLVADLAAAECFSTSHIERGDVKLALSQADFYYSSGFFLTVSVESILQVAQICLKRDKIFMMNLSAPFLTTIFKDNMMAVMPYVDILFGNEAEALSFAKEHNFGTENLQEIAIKMSALEKKNPRRSRIVIITHGTKPVILYKDGSIKEFEVPVVPKEEIVDTNGAGDAFVGGFMAQLVKGNSLEVCIECGIWAAGQIIRNSGCTFSGKPDFKPRSSS